MTTGVIVKKLMAVLMSSALFGASVAVAMPAGATVAGQLPQQLAAAKCINLKTGIARDLPGKKCPKGWVANGSTSWKDKRRTYLRDARALQSDLYLVQDSTLFEAGKATCQILDRGGNFGQIVSSIIDSGLDSDVGAAVVVSAINNLCPGHKTFLNNWLNS
jgi:hypothetical protein